MNSQTPEEKWPWLKMDVVTAVAATELGVIISTAR